MGAQDPNQAWALSNHLKDYRLNKQATEAHLVLQDGSILHFRKDRFGSFVQASGSMAKRLEPAILNFEFDRRTLKVSFVDGSGLEVAWRGGFLGGRSLDTRVREA
ncbi:conserved hypothetical protein [Allomeiothermus silvanus DSM 9946]|uniref:Uncharacterized protein n=1 Tax=Allomeiothermus silvanus (strain ATCC 700542 / DSM 9946 / NBRC 106475 / NCIMB 13440 / VI-R2) TaxID=526227 RepID=D7BAP1_ALLS1|nr:hypothetical protein [Allomeiothermus silvanus]ADH62563.1 conserved hypothetical protein [Allomeiothermus silvanus DSM 9946]